MNRLERVQEFLSEQPKDDISNHYSIHHQSMNPQEKHPRDPEMYHTHVRRGTLAARIKHFLGKREETPTMMPSELDHEQLTRLRSALIARELKRGRGQDPGDLQSAEGRTPTVNLSPEEIESAKQRIRTHLKNMGSSINIGEDQ